MKKFTRNTVRPTFFSSRSGRTLVTVLAGTAATGLFLINYVPHTFGLDRYRAFMQCNRNGQPMPVSPKSIERLEKACNLLDLKGPEKDMLRPFSVFGFDVFAAGSTKSRFGVLIGIPSNYEIDNPEDLKKQNVCYQGSKIKWDSNSGKVLENALILTEEEQIFGFCKALLQTQNHYYLLNSIFPSLSFLSVYTVGHYLNLSLNLLRGPFIIRLVMYSILCLFGCGTWSFMKDFNQVETDTEIDVKLSSISPEMLKAGIGYYEKQLNKNIAFREISKNTTYTAKGNHNYFLRQKSLPITVRKSYFEDKYAEHLKTVNL